MTVILDPPDTTALVLTFGVILLAALVLSYGVGYLGLSW